MLKVEDKRITQEDRLHALHERCAELNDSWKEANWRAISVNRQKRVVMCLVGKAAGTTWMRLLLRLTGDPQAANLATINRHLLYGPSAAFLGRFHLLSASTRRHYLTGNYYKVMFVREPLERLISGYRDKMFRAVDYVGLRTQIKRMFRPNVSERFAKSYTSLLKHYIYFGRFIYNRRQPVKIQSFSVEKKNMYGLPTTY